MFADALVMAKRHILHLVRTPDELIPATIQPAITILLSRYIMGGALAIPGTSYANYVMAGVFVQSVIFGSAATGLGVATDVRRGNGPAVYFTFQALGNKTALLEQFWAIKRAAADAILKAGGTPSRITTLWDAIIARGTIGSARSNLLLHCEQSNASSIPRTAESGRAD